MVLINIILLMLIVRIFISEHSMAEREDNVRQESQPFTRTGDTHTQIFKLSEYPRRNWISVFKKSVGDW